jgi:hypothetical protein
LPGIEAMTMAAQIVPRPLSDDGRGDVTLDDAVRPRDLLIVLT